jgi:hypothetical protein
VVTADFTVAFMAAVEAVQVMAGLVTADMEHRVQFVLFGQVTLDISPSRIQLTSKQ